MMQQDIVRAHDGTFLYYEQSGRLDTSGPVAVLCDGIGCDGFVWRYLRPWLERRCRVIHPHYRGHGSSGRSMTPAAYRIEQLVQDLEVVLDHSGAQQIVLLGHSMGVQVALEASTMMPKDRVQGLVLMCGSYGRPLDTFRDSAIASELLPFLKEAVRRYGQHVAPVIQRLTASRIGWWVARATELDASKITRDEFEPYLKHMAAMDPNIFLEMLTGAAAHTVEQHLPEIEIPALVVGAEFDRFTPYWVSEVMAQRMPNAELLCLHGGTHAAPLEQPERLEVALATFCARQGLWEASGPPQQSRISSRYV